MPATMWVALRPGPWVGTTVLAGVRAGEAAAMELCEGESPVPLFWEERPAGSWRAGSAEAGWWTLTPVPVACKCCADNDCECDGARVGTVTRTGDIQVPAASAPEPG